MEGNEGKVAIVTGAAQGIGKATAKLLLHEGWRVVIADIDEQAGSEAQAELAPFGEAMFVQTDVAREADVQNMVEETVARHTGIDALVNNAGIELRQPLRKLALAEWDRVLAVNLTGAMLCAKHALPHLRAVRGSIVNIASTRALQSEGNTEAYSASKGGLLALTHALAISLGPDVRVNCVSPGWIDVSEWKKKALRRASPLREADHRQQPAGRVGRPEDIAAMVAYLVSPRAEFITGQNLVLDGGMTRKMIYVE